MSPDLILVTSGAVIWVWGVSLALLLVVALVVALLLYLIRSTARQILAGASAIWTQGQLVANNTIQIPLLLGRTVRTVGRIRGEVEIIGGATEAIRSHARECPGCPDCVFSRKEA